jgi:hypothetical protein
MSTKHLTSCDHCKRAAPIDEGPDSKGHRDFAAWLQLGISGRGYSIEGVHICDRCIVALADFLPGVARENIGAFATHESSIGLDSGERIMRGQTVEITTRVETTFGPRRFEIENAANWLVIDVIVGNRSQVKPRNAWPKKLRKEDTSGVPGAVFVEESVNFTFETVPPDCDLRLQVAYVGENPEGAQFVCKVHGLAAGFAPEAART